MRRVPMEKIKLAKVRWCDIMRQTDSHHGFYPYLGVLETKIRWRTFLTLPDEAADKIEKLCGPHWYALLKIYIAKQGNGK